jgi:hypothetical protein
MSINKEELIKKLSLIDEYFSMQSHIPNDEIEKFGLEYFSGAFRACFPKITAKLKKDLSLYLHPDKILRADSILIKWKSFLQSHPDLDPGIPFKSLQHYYSEQELINDISNENMSENNTYFTILSSSTLTQLTTKDLIDRLNFKIKFQKNLSCNI